MSFNSQSDKVLFVDDEESILSGFKLTLGREFNLSFASSGIEGLEVYRKEGPFAVMVFDYMMPKMNGAEFLMEIRKMDQDVVAILLSGASNFEAASNAVRNGKIFRFLSKPCDGVDLKEHIHEAMEHFHTMRVADEVLWDTMSRTFKAVTSFLAAAKPLYFGRAERVRRLASQLARELGVKDIRLMELAVTFYYLRFLSFPEDVQERLYHLQEVSPSTQESLAEMPLSIQSALYEIPRLSRVIEIIQAIEQSYESGQKQSEEVRTLASIIRLSKNYDEAASLGYPRPAIFEWLLKNRSNYLPGGLEALSRIRDYSDGGPQVQSVELKSLIPGMRIQQDLRMSNGSLVAPKGSVISRQFIAILRNYQSSYASDPLPERIEVIMGSSYSNTS